METPGLEREEEKEGRTLPAANARHRLGILACWGLLGVRAGATWSNVTRFENRWPVPCGLALFNVGGGERIRDRRRLLRHARTRTTPLRPVVLSVRMHALTQKPPGKQPEN